MNQADFLPVEQVQVPNTSADTLAAQYAGTGHEQDWKSQLEVNLGLGEVAVNAAEYAQLSDVYTNSLGRMEQRGIDRAQAVIQEALFPSVEGTAPHKFAYDDTKAGNVDYSLLAWATSKLDYNDAQRMAYVQDQQQRAMLESIKAANEEDDDDDDEDEDKVA